MDIIRLPFFRYVLFCAIMLALLFSDLLHILNFFLIGALFSILEACLQKRGFDKKTDMLLLIMAG